jgi:protein SSD1
MYSNHGLSSTISLQRHNNQDSTTSTDNPDNTPREQPRLAWFKPNDKRVPFIALRNQDVPTHILDNEEYFKVHLFVVSYFH